MFKRSCCSKKLSFKRGTVIAYGYMVMVQKIGTCSPGTVGVKKYLKLDIKGKEGYDKYSTGAGIKSGVKNLDITKIENLVIEKTCSMTFNSLFNPSTKLPDTIVAMVKKLSCIFILALRMGEIVR